mgnify:FL=1
MQQVLLCSLMVDRVFATCRALENTAQLEHWKTVVCWRYSTQLSHCTLRIIGRFYNRGRIMRLDELGQRFVIRLVIRL